MGLNCQINFKFNQLEFRLLISAHIHFYCQKKRLIVIDTVVRFLYLYHLETKNVNVLHLTFSIKTILLLRVFDGVIQIQAKFYSS